MVLELVIFFATENTGLTSLFEQENKRKSLNVLVVNQVFIAIK